MKKTLALIVKDGIFRNDDGVYKRRYYVLAGSHRYLHKDLTIQGRCGAVNMLDHEADALHMILMYNIKHSTSSYLPDEMFEI